MPDSPVPLIDSASPAAMTLGQLGRISGLARASLLHYEQLGLLRPARRSDAGYRLYGPRELERLRTIRTYRDAGLSLAMIRTLLAAPAAAADANDPATLLAQRLHGLNADINRLREQQRTLARLLAASPALHACRSKADWVALLRTAGFSDADMQRWHEDFERADPDGHARFLQSIGLAPDEAGEVRRRSVVARLPPR